MALIDLCEVCALDKIRSLRGFGAFLPFLILNIIEYGIEHIRYLVYDSVLVGDVFELIITLFGGAVDIIEAIVPCAVGAVMLLVFAEGGLRVSLLTGGALALSRFFYLVPHYYMSNIFSGFDSIESLWLGAFSSVGIILLFSAEVAICFFLGLLPCYLKGKKTGEDMKNIIHSDALRRESLDVGNKVTAYVAIFALIMFCKMFAIVTIDVVSVLIKYNGQLPSRLLLPVVLEYAFAIVILVLTHFVGLMIVRRLTENKTASLGENEK